MPSTKAPTAWLTWPNWLRLVGAVLIAVSAISLAGRALNSAAIASVVPEGRPIAGNAALCQLVLGVAFWLLAAGRRRAAESCGWVVCGFAALIGAQNLTGTSFGLDELFFKHTLPPQLDNPGRMAPNAILLFLLGSVTMVLISRPRVRTGLVAIFSGLMLGMTLLAVLNYLTGLQLVLAGGVTFAMAPAIALSMMLVAITAIAGRDQGAGAGKSVRPLAISAAVLLTSVGLFSLYLNEDQEQTNRGLIRSYEVVASMNYVELLVTRMQSAARSFAVTGNEWEVQALMDNRARLRTELIHLKFLLSERVETRKQAEVLATFTMRESEFLERLVVTRRDEGPEAARLLVTQELDRPLMTAVRAQVNLMEEDERRRQEGSNRLVERVSRDTLKIVVLGNVLAGLFTFLALYLSRRAEAGRLQAVAEQREAAHLQRAVLDGIVHSVISTNLQGTITLFSRGAEEMLGYRAEEMVGRQTPENLHVAQEVVARAVELSAQLGQRIEPGFEAFIARARLGEVDEREWTYVRKDGRRLPVRLSITALRDAEGKITGFLGIARDVTEKKKAEMALKASEERLGQVLGHAECLVWEAHVNLRGDDWDWRMSVYPSALYRRLHGKAVTTDAAGLWYNFQIPEQEEMNRRSREAMAAGRPGYVQEFRLVNGSSVVWIRESVSIRVLGGDQFWLVGVAIEVTERKQLETALRYSEEQFRNAFDFAGTGMALVGLDGRWLRVNQILRHLLGYSEDELLARSFQDVTHPEDLQTDLANVEDLLAGRRRHYQMEKRYIHRDGRIVHVRLTVTLIRNPEDAPLHFIAQIEDITARHLAEQALIESQRQLSDVFRSMAEGLVVHDTQGRIIECNAAAETILGLSRAQLLGLSDIDPRWHLTLDDGTPCPPEQIPSTITRQTGRSLRGEVLGVCQPDGRRIWVSINTEAILDERGDLQSVVASFVDITAQRATEKELRKLALIASKTNNSVVLTDAERRIVWVNEGFTRITGYGLEEVYGRVPGRLLQGAATDPATVAHMRDCLRQGKGFLVELINYRKDGTPLWVRSEVQPILDREGKIEYYMAISLDITQHKQLEESLAQARDQALESSRMKSAFLANMSHEIRTPMNGVLGMSELLMDSPLNEEQRQMGSVIQNSARSLLTVIDDILDFSKIEAGKLAIEARVFDLPEQFDQALALLAPRAQARGLVLQGELPPEPPPPLLGDPARLQQILVNLLGNAIKFTEQGGVTLALLARPAAAGRYAFRVEVRDTGIGITAEQRQRLFQPFTQADDSMTRKYGGTGLGLAISRQLLELMGGRIDMSSEAGRGSVFWFELELPVAAKLPPKRPLGTASAPATRTARARILVAEDNEANQLVIRLMLGKLGLDHDIVEDGLAALERVAQGGYVAILMDCQMPGLDGYETSRRIRAGSAGAAHKHIPIFALTAHAMASDRQKCLEAGMDDYLPKPVRLDVLQKALARFGIATTSLGLPVAPPPEPVEPVLEAGHLQELRALPGERPGESLLDVLARKSLEELPSGFSRLQNLADTQAAAELGQLAHRLAGSAASIGAMPLRTLLLSLEQAARRADWAAVARHRSELDRQWRLLQDALRALRPPPTP